jgi:hypothetical protein
VARTVRNSKIDTRSARTKLVVRREPYWTAISRGCALGYRRGSKGGSWVARFRDKDKGKQHYEALGAADDARDSDGLTVFDYGEAQARARDFFVRKPREIAGDDERRGGPYTVAEAVEAYFLDRERRGSRGLAKRPRCSQHAHSSNSRRIGCDAADRQTDRRLARRTRDYTQADAHLSLRKAPNRSHHRFPLTRGLCERGDRQRTGRSQS